MSAPSAPLLAWSGATDRGPVRANNEDSFLALAFDHEQTHRLSRMGRTSLGPADCLFAVSDGMGGAHSGEFASRITLDQVMRLVPRGFRRSAGGTVHGFGGILEEIFRAIHRDLLQLGRSYEECAGMGATLSLGWFTPGAMYFAHIGDSRIYHLPAGGKLAQLTEDHSHVGWLRRTGQLNEREARNHAGRNALQQVLGAGHQFMEPQVGGIACGAGDRFLFCTDGLVDGLWDARLEEALRQGGEDLAGSLVREAVAASGRDNATAVEVEVLPAP
ncbi:MAG TPA: protein phosphatase 2C domain-containing protein [Opitutaceae bacterium]|jgi:protein phosphatase|nr:protein phosphatase 2C domain-containing protein [Opitutaceae bacterium]